MDRFTLACGTAKRFAHRRPIDGSDMLTTKLATLARIAPALALWSCAAPKAIVVELPRAKNNPSATAPEVADSTLPTLPDDGIRLPDMLGMPGDGDFHATAPTVPKGQPDASAVISRPPTDPPSRPKPSKDTAKDTGKE